MVEWDFTSHWDYRDCRLENNGLIPKSCGYNKTFKYVINVQQMKDDYIDWCMEKCKSNWGWHFDDDYAFISFNSKKEAFLFNLSIR